MIRDTGAPGIAKSLRKAARSGDRQCAFDEQSADRNQWSVVFLAWRQAAALTG